MDFSPFCSDGSWDSFAFRPHNTMCPQLCYLLCEQGLQQLVFNLLHGGIMWSLTFLCSDFLCPSETAYASHTSLTVSFTGWRDLAYLFFSPIDKLFYTSSYPITFFCTFSVLMYRFSVISSVCTNQATNPHEHFITLYNTLNILITMF